MPDPTAPQTAEELREAQKAEYGVYIAAGPIFIEGARAFNEGDPVPKSHVERGVVSKDEVKTLKSQAGQALAAGTSESKG